MVVTLYARSSRKISSLERRSRRSTSSGWGSGGGDNDDEKDGVGEGERGMRSMFWSAPEKKTKV